MADRYITFNNTEFEITNKVCCVCGVNNNTLSWDNSGYEYDALILCSNCLRIIADKLDIIHKK